MKKGIKISKVNIYEEPSISDIFDKIGNKMSQSVVDVYLQDILMYNVLDKKYVDLIKVATSDKSLRNVEVDKKDYVRADIFKNILDVNNFGDTAFSHIVDSNGDYILRADNENIDVYQNFFDQPASYILKSKKTLKLKNKLGE